MTGRARGLFVTACTAPLWDQVPTLPHGAATISARGEPAPSGIIRSQENRPRSFHEHHLPIPPSAALQLLTTLNDIGCNYQKAFWVSSDKGFPFPSSDDGPAAAETPHSTQAMSSSCLEQQQLSLCCSSLHCKEIANPRKLFP